MRADCCGDRTIAVFVHQCVESQNRIYLCAGIYRSLSLRTDRRRGGRRDCRLHRCDPVPDRRYFPGFTLTCVITGAVYGLLLHKKQTPLRILIAIAIVQLGCRASGNHLLDLRPVRLTVYGTFGDTQCAVFDHDSGRVYRHRCDEPPACAA